MLASCWRRLGGWVACWWLAFMKGPVQRGWFSCFFACVAYSVRMIERLILLLEDSALPCAHHTDANNIHASMRRGQGRSGKRTSVVYYLHEKRLFPPPASCLSTTTTTLSSNCTVSFKQFPNLKSFQFRAPVDCLKAPAVLHFGCCLCEPP